MVSVLTSSAEAHGFDPQPGQSKALKWLFDPSLLDTLDLDQ